MQGMLGLGCLWVLVAAAGCSAAPDAADGTPMWTVAAPIIHSAPEAVDCGKADDDLPSARMDRPTKFWAEDALLQETLGRVLARLNAATGLGLSVELGGIDVVLTDLPPEYSGYASDHIDVDVEVTGPLVDLVLIHEVGHMLGAGHLGPFEGVMSRCTGADSEWLTDPDLMQICSGAPCTTFRPEIRPEVPASEPELDATDAG